MYYKVLKLTNGDTVMADISEETKTYIDVMRPIQIMSMQKNNGTMQVVFMKWDHSFDFKLPVRVFKSAIVSVGEPDEECIKSYKEIYEKYASIDKISEETETLSFEDDEHAELNESLDELMKLMLEASNKSKQTLH